jgi:hypothetical protein
LACKLDEGGKTGQVEKLHSNKRREVNSPGD